MKEQRKRGFMSSLMKLSFVLLVVGLTVGLSLPSAHAQRLLFYNSGNGSGADGHIESSGFVTDHSYGAGSFGTWTQIAGDGFHLLFYNSGDGSGADGHVNQTGGFVTDHSYGAGSFGTWTHVVGRI